MSKTKNGLTNVAVIRTLLCRWFLGDRLQNGSP